MNEIEKGVKYMKIIVMMAKRVYGKTKDVKRRIHEFYLIVLDFSCELCISCILFAAYVCNINDKRVRK